MKHWQIGQLSKETNISIRTLRHYDRIGLLCPHRRSDSGYRLYSTEDRQRLFDILFYRALGFSLYEIGEILDAKPEHRSQFLQQQHVALEKHIQRLSDMRIRLRQEINKENRKVTNTTTIAGALNGFDPDRFEKEVVETWGETDAYKVSTNRTSAYSEEDWARYKTESKQLNDALGRLYKAGVAPTDPEALDVVEKLRLQIDEWFYPCSREMHASLGEMYVSDERFTAFYDAIEPGLAEYLRDGTLANLNTNT